MDVHSWLRFFQSAGREREPGEEPLAPESLAGLFTHVADGLGQEGVGREDFVSMMRMYMKAIKDTLITDVLSIKEAKTIRRLEAGEVVEVLDGPVEEATVSVLRVCVRAMKDDQEGWVTMAGNKGGRFLEEGGNTFKVVKDTVLGESFEPGPCLGDPPGDSSRTLKEGELVEVRQWPRREPESGTMRAQCRALSDGRTGWATSADSTGTIFLQTT